MIIYLVTLSLCFLTYFHYFVEPVSLLKTRSEKPVSTLKSFLSHASMVGVSELLKEKELLDSFYHSRPYKYFNGLVIEFLKLSKTKGVFDHKLFKRLRIEVQNDEKYEDKKSQEQLTGYFQISIVYLLTWLFYFFSTNSLEVLPSKKIILFFICWQLIGLGLYRIYFIRRYRMILNGVEELLFTALTLKSLLPLSLSCNELFSIAKISSLNNNPKKIFKDRLIELCQKYKNLGVSIEDDLENLLSELWYDVGKQQQKFIKTMAPFRLGVILVFGLVPYFINIMSIIDSLTL